MSEETLLNGKELAASVPCCPMVITAAKAAGYCFKYGTKTTRSHYLKWLKEHPLFRVTGYVLAHSKKGLPTRKQRRRGRRA